MRSFKAVTIDSKYLIGIKLLINYKLVSLLKATSPISYRLLINLLKVTLPTWLHKFNNNFATINNSA